MSLFPKGYHDLSNQTLSSFPVGECVSRYLENVPSSGSIQQPKCRQEGSSSNEVRSCFQDLHHSDTGEIRPFIELENLVDQVVKQCLEGFPCSGSIEQSEHPQGTCCSHLSTEPLNEGNFKESVALLKKEEEEIVFSSLKKRLSREEKALLVYFDYNSGFES